MTLHVTEGVVLRRVTLLPIYECVWARKMSLGKKSGATASNGKPNWRIRRLLTVYVVTVHTLHFMGWAIRINHPVSRKPATRSHHPKVKRRCESSGETALRATIPVSLCLFGRTGNDDDGDRDVVLDTQQADTRRHRRTVRLMADGEEAIFVSRTIPILPNWNITVWELKDTSDTVNAYWEGQSRQPPSEKSHKPATSSSIRKPQRQLDPFGLVSWPGSVKAAQELYKHATRAVRDQSVVVLGAGVGVEAQAAAMLGAKSVVATDIHPTTLLQLRCGVDHADQIVNKDVVNCQLLDLFSNHPLPTPCDLLVVADVLYNQELASQVCRRCADALEQNPNVRILITDSQRFVPTFIDELNTALEGAWKKGMSSSRLACPRAWHGEIVMRFTGSGVIIEGDQTYDVRVQTIWVGLLPSPGLKNLTTSPTPGMP
jgi:predicted nicotinamide N-methyase